ncbi:Cleaved Adhesin Domain [Prevotellaceae bacterium MN60]|nr:Cleaved Adhesin Domain [Prevotellaceae bacterium MN60]
MKHYLNLRHYKRLLFMFLICFAGSISTAWSQKALPKKFIADNSGMAKTPKSSTLTIIAGVVKADSWTLGNNKEGIYRLEVKEDGQLVQLNADRDVLLAPLGGAVYQDGTMYGIHFKQEWDDYDQAFTYTIYNVAYDMDSWTRTKAQALNNMYGNLISSCGITHDPVTGLNFGIFYNFNMNYEVINRKLATIDFVNTETSGAPKKQIIGIVDTPFAAIAASDNGFLYGVGQDGYLYIIDKELEAEANSVAVYPLGDLGIEDISTNPSSMVFDPNTKKLYWSYVSTNQKSYLYEINYTIGQVSATRIMQLPDNAYLVNMYIAPMEAADDAPAAVSNLTASFEGEQTTGTVSFTMPTLSYSDDPLVGELSYTIYADGEAVATGTAQVGEEVTQQTTVASEGRDVVISVAAKNAAGEGPLAKSNVYIGRDTPQAVSNLHLKYNNDSEYMTLTWKEPTEGIHGITLTQRNLEYNVVRQPDGVTVAQGLKLPTFGEKIVKTPELKGYYYDVVVVNGSHESEVATSNKVIVGQALVPPFDEDFTTQEGFDRFTVVDGNNDGKTWKRLHKTYSYSGTTIDYAQIIAGYQQADDDYLLTPPLQLQNGGRYTLTFTASKGYASAKYDQKLRILIGMGDNLADYDVVMDNIEVTDVNLETFTAEIPITADGIYQIAIHAISDAGSDQLNIDELHLSTSLVATAPEAAQNIVATANADGYLSGSVTFTAPSKNLHGDDLTAISRIIAIDDGDNILGSLDNPTPGAQCTMEINNLKNGTNTYYLVAYNGNDRGAKAPFTLFAGQDYPMQPIGVSLTDNGTEAILTWQAPTKGLNGLTLNPDLLTYNLYGIAADGSPALIKAGIKSPYRTGVPTATGNQQLLYYAIDAENSAGLSELVATNSLVIGQPYTLPYIDVFDKTNQQFVWIEGDYADWNIGLVKMSSDGDEDGYALAFQPNRADFGNYNLGKLTLNGATQPTLSFDYYAIPASQPATLSVLADTHQNGNTDLLTTIDYQKETAEGWKHVTLDLSKYVSEPYIIVKFAMASLKDAENEVVIVFDNVRIEDKTSSAISEHTNEGVNSKVARKGIFRLDGTRVNAGAMTKGIYIIDGRKTVVK